MKEGMALLSNLPLELILIVNEYHKRAIIPLHLRFKYNIDNMTGFRIEHHQYRTLNILILYYYTKHILSITRWKHLCNVILSEIEGLNVSNELIDWNLIMSNKRKAILTSIAEEDCLSLIMFAKMLFSEHKDSVQYYFLNIMHRYARECHIQKVTVRFIQS